MLRRRPRFILFLFALLQCVAPLLHAHPHVGGHSGLHFVHLADAGATLAPGASCTAAQHDDWSLGLSPSLQPRPDPAPGLPVAGRAALLPRQTQGGPRLPPGTPERLPDPPARLIPLPGPPPTL